MTICESCGAALHVGDFPFCGGTPENHARGANSVEAVTWPGGKTFHNLANTPVTFYHYTDYKRYLKAHNLEPMIRNAGPLDKYVPVSMTMDAHTLANATALVSRGRTPEAAAPTYVASMELSETVTDDAPIRVRVPR
jgi:hypothetical protein